VYTNKEKADEARREVGYREHVYERRVNDGKMSRQTADRRIAIMKEIQEEYEAAAATERLL
jgi:hypothetical protein